MTNLQILYKRANTGKIQQWQIFIDGNAYYTIAGQVGGKLTQTKPSFAEAKNVGKANETTANEQALVEATAKWQHKLDHGYSKNQETVDSTGYEEPMLAHKFVDYADEVTYPNWVDDKLNGVRCKIKKNNPTSRKNKPFNTIPHIVKELQPFYDQYPNLYLDGELFNPNLKNKQGRIDLGDMVKLISVAIKPKDVTPELLAKSEKLVQYHVYDGFGFNGITEETSFIERRKALNKLLKGLKYVFVVKYTECKNRAEVDALLAQSKKEKREGIIIRWGDCAYEYKRSKSLLKYKNWITEEFEIVEIQEGDADWAGCAKRAVFKLPNPVMGRDGKPQSTFAAGIEGDRKRAQEWFKNRKEIVGKLGSVTFGEYSKYGVPLTPVLECIRNYE
jgi:ATP-dependent DNA ligase